MNQSKPLNVKITGGTIWIGLMLAIIAINTCEMKKDIQLMRKSCAESSATIP